MKRLFALTVILLTITAPALAGNPKTDLSYVIRRRPAPTANAREVALPSNVVIDATTALTTRERSRLPIDPLTGYVDILIKPDGSVVPTTIYSSPSSVLPGLVPWFTHFWLAERADVVPPVGTVSPELPIGSLALPGAYSGPTLSGECMIVSLNYKTGQVTVTASPTFDNPNSGNYLTMRPFLPAQQGAQ
jgi:hypothetical protein